MQKRAQNVIPIHLENANRNQLSTNIKFTNIGFAVSSDYLLEYVCDFIKIFSLKKKEKRKKHRKRTEKIATNSKCHKLMITYSF